MAHLFWICVLLLGSIGVQALLEVSRKEDVALFERWQNQIKSQLKETSTKGCTCCGHPDSDIIQWTNLNCQGNQTCSIFISQDVQRFGRFRYISMMAPESLLEDLEGVSTVLEVDKMELEAKVEQLTKLIAFLEDEESAEPFTDVEVQEQAKLARMALHSKDGQIELFVGKTQTPEGVAIDEKHSCKCGHLTKSLSMYGNQALAETNPVDENGVVQLGSATSIYYSGLTGREQGIVNNRFAALHPGLTYLYMYFPGSFITMMPCSHSGPEFPQASCVTSGHSCGCGWLPWSRMFGPHISCASPLLMLTANNPATSVWFESCQYGLLTFSPWHMARSSCWMLPGVGNVGGSVPGRVIDDRTFCGSHPCGSSFNSGNPESMVKGTRLYLAPLGMSTDPRLVEILYQLEAQNASFSRLTFYTSQLTVLAVLGLNPRHYGLQHHGVQLTLTNGALPVPGGPSLKHALLERPQVLTMEMMQEGLIWGIREKEVDSEEVHSFDTYEFDQIKPAVVANFLVDQKGLSYKDGDCQVFAKKLMDRLLAHSITVDGKHIKFSPKSVFTFTGDAEEVTNRARLIFALLIALLVTCVSFQWAVICRVLVHLHAGSASEKGRFWYTAELVADDLQRANKFGTHLLGERVMTVLRFLVMVVHAPAFWYWSYCKALQWRRKVSAEQEAPLLE